MGDEGLGLWMRHEGGVFVAGDCGVIVPVVKGTEKCLFQAPAKSIIDLGKIGHDGHHDFVGIIAGLPNENRIICHHVRTANTAPVPNVNGVPMALFVGAVSPTTSGHRVCFTAAGYSGATLAFQRID